MQLLPFLYELSCYIATFPHVFCSVLLYSRLDTGGILDAIFQPYHQQLCIVSFSLWWCVYDLEIRRGCTMNQTCSEGSESQPDTEGPTPTS